jgi:GNAT superfamily N-acetyltransferase
MTSERSFTLRALRDDDVPEYADLLFSAFNAWWWKHGLCKDFYDCNPIDVSIFYKIYNDMSPGCSVAAFHKDTGRMMGACYYHPREYHVSLGIMSVHPNYGGQGVGRAMVDYILDYTKDNGYKACRLVGSAMNLDSFSLYNRSGFVPRLSYQDMMLDVPSGGMDVSVPGEHKVREARLEDVQSMADLEMEVSGVTRLVDYPYWIKNPRGVMHATVYENDQGGIEGFLNSVKCPAINILGPCVARSEEVAIALIRRELERYRGIVTLFVIPTTKRKMVETFYEWKAFNVETHFKQVWGEFQEYRGVSLPSYLPETE